MAHAGQPQGIPHHGRRCRNHRFTEVLLELLQDRDGGHAGSTQKYRLRFWHVDRAAELIGALRRLLVNVRDILEATAAHHLKAVFHQMGVGLVGDLTIVRRPERDALDGKAGERCGDTAERRRNGHGVLSLHALNERGLGTLAQRITRRRMRDHHHTGLYQREQASGFVNVLNLGAVAFLLPVMASGGAMRDHPREMHRYTGRRHRRHFWFDRWVARRNEKAEPRTPSLHGHRPPPGAQGKSSNTATARIGEPVPPRHLSGKQMNRNSPRPSRLSRLHRLSMCVIPSSKHALCTSVLTIPSGPGRMESMPKCTMPCSASHSVAATFTPGMSVA